MTKHRRGPRPLSLALDPLRDRLAPATPLAELQRVWPTVVGAVIAAEAQPVAERAGVVTVACQSAAWAQELDMMSATVINRLNEQLSRTKVTRLRCVTAGSE